MKIRAYKKKADAPERKKAEELVSQMTFDEKLSQITESWGIGGVKRLGIPPLFKSETVHGNSYSTGAASFPHAIAMGATWDTELVEKIGEVTAEETVSAGALQGWSPLLDVARDPRWGRVEEAYGEDPVLVEKIGLAWIHGFQSKGLTATPKHFAAHGSPLGGRDSNDYGYSERVLREIHYAPFRAAVKKENVQSVMSAYHSLEGIPATGSDELLNKILREEWGFTGYVVSDVGAPDNLKKKLYTCKDDAEGAAYLVKGGVDLCAPGDVYKKGIAAAIEKGLLTEEDVNERVRTILEVKLRLGAFEKGLDRQIWEDVECWDCPEHRAVALEAAEKCAVLLKNNGLLPISDKTAKIAVIGPAAEKAEQGDYTGKFKESQTVSILEGIRRRVPDAEVVYAKGCDFLGEADEAMIAEAKKAALDADIVIMVLGDKGDKTTGENNDRADIDLVGAQNELMHEILSLGKPVAVLLAVGKPTAAEEAFEKADAVMVTWYAGEEAGTAAAKLIFGDTAPSGKLPMSFPKSSKQLPIFYSYNMSGRGYDYIDIDSAPRARFGQGLTYTTFAYSDASAVVTDNGVKITAKVKNTGSREGVETIQLYVTDMYSSAATPLTLLKDFAKVTLAAGEEKEVEFVLDWYALSFLGADMVRRAEKGEFRAFIGGISPYCDRGNDNRKERMGYADSSEGVDTVFALVRDYAADFRFEKLRDGENTILRVTNAGDLCDVVKTELYACGELAADVRSEVEEGETVEFVFENAPVDALIRIGKKLI